MKLLCIGLIIFLFTFSYRAKAEVSPPIAILTEEWPPFNYQVNNNLTGFATEVVQLVMRDLKINIQIEVLPGARAMKVLNTSQRTFFYSMIRTPEREKRYKWIGPFGDQAIYFYKKKDSPLKIKSMEDAKKVNAICCRESGLVFSMLKEAGFKNLQVGVGAEGIYLRAIKERCDLAIGEDSLGVAYWLKVMKQPADSLERTPVKLISSPLYIVASKDVPDSEIALWQKSLEKIKASQAYQELEKKYGK